MISIGVIILTGEKEKRHSAQVEINGSAAMTVIDRKGIHRLTS